MPSVNKMNAALVRHLYGRLNALFGVDVDIQRDPLHAAYETNRYGIQVHVEAAKLPNVLPDCAASAPVYPDARSACQEASDAQAVAQTILMEIRHMSPKPELATPDESVALQAFAKAHGRRWKSTLIETYWYNARIWRDANDDTTHGTVLHGLRNRLGLKWLDSYKLPKIT